MAQRPYKTCAARELKVPEAKVEDIFKRVRLGVRVTSRVRRSLGEHVAGGGLLVHSAQAAQGGLGCGKGSSWNNYALWERIKASTDPAPLSISCAIGALRRSGARGRGIESLPPPAIRSRRVPCAPTLPTRSGVSTATRARLGARPKGATASPRLRRGDIQQRPDRTGWATVKCPDGRRYTPRGCARIAVRSGTAVFSPGRATSSSNSGSCGARRSRCPPAPSTAWGVYSHLRCLSHAPSRGGKTFG